MTSDQKLIELVKARTRAGDRPSTILRQLLKDRRMTTADIAFLLMDTFHVEQSDVSCVSGWWPDGSLELNDKQIDEFLIPVIEKARDKWDKE